jgi:hypothetical protein
MAKSQRPAADEGASALGLGSIGVMLRVSAWPEYRRRHAVRKSVGSTAAAQQSNRAARSEMFENTT